MRLALLSLAEASSCRARAVLAQALRPRVGLLLLRERAHRLFHVGGTAPLSATLPANQLVRIIAPLLYNKQQDDDDDNKRTNLYLHTKIKSQLCVFFESRKHAACRHREEPPLPHLVTCHVFRALILKQEKRGCSNLNHIPRKGG